MRRRKCRTIGELGTADPVVDVDVRVIDVPALARGVRFGVLDLAYYGALLVRDAVLLGGFSSVDCNDHGLR